MKKLLAMVLAAAMMLSLCVFPAGATTASSDGVILGSGTDDACGIEINTQEITAGPYYAGSIISYKITIKFTQEIAIKTSGNGIKIHNYNTNSHLDKFAGVVVLNGGKDENNEQFKIYEYEVSTPNIVLGQTFTAPGSDIYFKCTDGRVHVNDSITLWMRFLVTKHSSETKTLDNFIGITVYRNGEKELDLGKEFGEGTQFQETVQSDQFPLQIINNIEGETSSAAEFIYTVQSSDKTFTKEVNGVQFTGGKATFELGDGDSKILYLPTSNDYVVEQTENTSYKTTSTHDSIAIGDIGKEEKKQSYDAVDGTNGQGAKVNYTWKVQEADNQKLHTVTFTNSRSATNAAGVTYHLNLPKDASFVTGSDKEGKDYVYTDTAGTTVKEIKDIPSFVNQTSSTDTIVAGGAGGDDFKTYNQGYLKELGDNGYHFVGWSKTENAVFTVGGSVNYKDIDYPVVNIVTSGTRARNIYYDGAAEYTVAAGAQLYAVWAPASNSGLMGYTMQIPDGDFPGAGGHIPGSMYTGADSSGQKLGVNGMGGEGAWYKYVVLDGGHAPGGDFNVASDVPQYYGSDPNYKQGESKTTTFVAWKLKNKGKSGDTNTKYLVDPTGSDATVKYGGKNSVYSLDAVWATVTAPDDKTVVYNGSPQYPDIGKLTTTFNSDAVSGNDAAVFAALFANDGGGGKNTHVSYTYEVTKAGESVSPTGKSAGGVPGVTDPGVYKYTIKAFYSVDASETIDGKTVGTTITGKPLGQVSFIFVVQPRLAVNVTKEVTDTSRSYTWPAAGFQFSVAVAGGAGAKVTGGDITIKEDTRDHKGTAYVEFTAAGDYTITIHETTSGELGMTYALDRTVKVKATVGDNGFITLANDDTAPGNVSAEADGSAGNLKADVTMTNTYSTGSLTVTKQVADNGSKKGDGKDFTITVTFGNWDPPKSLEDEANITGVSGRTVTLSLQNGKSATIENIPDKATYTVRETDPQGATASYSATSGTISAKDTNTVTVTNTYPEPVGTLTITKEVTGSNVPASMAFSFTITADTSIQGKVAGKSFDGIPFDDDGEATVVVTAVNKKGSKTIAGLPIGEYTVKESLPVNTNCKFGGVTVDGASSGSGNPFTVTVEEDKTTTAAVTNTYTQPTGSLKVEKKLVGATGAGETFKFSVTFDNVPAEGFTLAGDASDKVTKNGQSVDVTITGASSKTLGGIPVGVTYTVKETDAGGYVSASTTASGTITKDETKTAAFTNYATGSLEVTKTVTPHETEHVTPPPGATFPISVQFTLPIGVESCQVTVNGAPRTIKSGDSTIKIELSNEGKCTFEGLPVGTTYTVTEELTPDQQKNYASAIEDGSGKIEASTKKTAAVTNTYYEMAKDTGALWIRKVVQGTGSGSSSEFEFTVEFRQGSADKTKYDAFTSGLGGDGAKQTVKLKDGQTKVFLGIPVGTEYTVQETSPDVGDGGLAHVVMAVAPGDGRGEGTEANDETRTVTGKINESRDVDGVTVYNQYLDTLTLELVLDNAENIPKGTEFTFTLYFSGLEADQVSSLMEIVDDTGTRTSKELLPDFRADDKVTITLIKGESMKALIKHVPLGLSTYTITEEGANKGSQVKYAVGSGKVSDPIETGYTTGDQTFGEETKYVTMKNTYANSGWLTVTKEVTGTNPPKAAEYTFEIRHQEDNSLAETVTITGAGSQTVSLPEGSYVVTETTSGSFTKTYAVGGKESASSAQVTITADNTVTVTVTNNYTPPAPPVNSEPDPGSEPYVPPEELNTGDHVAYIIGNPGGEVKPESSITRAEVVTILFRLLKDDVRSRYWSTENGFSDTSRSAWYNNAVSTIARLKLVEGNPDGTFRPNGEMSRAELAAVISRLFDPAVAERGKDFDDVDKSAWYYQYVRIVSALGIMTGVSDTEFIPEAPVKRSEAMATFNRLLDHRPTVDGLIEEGTYLNKWPDNANKSAWYYADVQEATNSHTCETFSQDGLTRERWTAVLPAPDWAAYETEWATANGAG